MKNIHEKKGKGAKSLWGHLWADLIQGYKAVFESN